MIRSLSAVGCLFLLPSVFAVPSATVTAPAVKVYDFYTQHCPPLPQPGCATDIDKGCDCDISDAPLRFWFNGTNIFGLGSVDLGSRAYAGSTVDEVHHTCYIYANSTNNMDITAFDNHEWIHSSVFFPENNTVYALTHNEYHCDREGCPCYPNCDGIPASQLGFLTGVTLMQSMDGGLSWAHSRPPPYHSVAVFPYAWNISLGRNPGYYGFRSPSSIVKSRMDDGYYYATVTAAWGSNELGQQAGACMMRTRDVTDPTSWLAWGGSSFNISLYENPWLNPTIDPALHRCIPFTNTTYASLLWSTLYNSYIYFGTHNGDDDGGWWFSLSKDLITWSDWTMLTVPDNYLPVGGNGTITPPPPNMTMPGRFIMRNTSGNGEIWWEDPTKTFKYGVGTCTICPETNACQLYVKVSDSEFDNLINRTEFSCGLIGWNATGISHLYYPTLIDSSAPSLANANFDSIGSEGTLFLVSQRCVSASGNGNGISCSPFDVNGLLVRDMIKVPITFST